MYLLLRTEMNFSRFPLKKNNLYPLTFFTPYQQLKKVHKFHFLKMTPHNLFSNTAAIPLMEPNHLQNQYT